MNNDCTCDYPDGLADETAGCQVHGRHLKRWNFHWEQNGNATIGRVRIDGDHSVSVRIYEPKGILSYVLVKCTEFSANWVFTLELSETPTLRDQVETIVTGILSARGYDPETTQAMFFRDP